MVTSAITIYPLLAQAIEDGLRSTGLDERLSNVNGGQPLVDTLKNYLTVMAGGFTRVDMMAAYHRHRAMFAMLQGDYYFNSILGQIQVGDTALFYGGFFCSNDRRIYQATTAKAAYHDVAVMLRGNHSENKLFSLLEGSAFQVMNSLSATAEFLRLPTQNKYGIYVHGGF